MRLLIQPDIEKATSIMKSVNERIEFVERFNEIDFTSVICENYYEIIKEISSAIFLIKGIKFVGEFAHKELLDEICKLLGLDDEKFAFLDDLRKRRNGSLYYGEKFDNSYLKMNKKKLDDLVNKLKRYFEGAMDNEK